MFEKENVDALEELTGLTLVDVDRVATYEILLLGRTQEIRLLEDQIGQMKDNEFLLVEKLFDMAVKGSEEYRDLSNADKRSIKVKDNLAESKKYQDLVRQCAKLRHEAVIMQIAIDSLKRRHEREVKGLSL